MNTNWKILEDESQINKNKVWKEIKTLNFRDIDKGICEICGISNHQQEDIGITVFSNGTENKSFCEDCLYNLPLES